jgi:D-lactate dehydrogenase (cytochrome)
VEWCRQTAGKLHSLPSSSELIIDSGTNAFRYGTMKDWVLNLTVVLPNGEVIKTRRRPRKTSAGYNLTSLFVGAEGTLGMVTEITLKLAVIPQSTSVAVVSFPTIADAANAACGLIRSGIQLAALEMMDDVQMQVVNRHGSAAVRKRSWDEKPTLFLKSVVPRHYWVES